MYYGRKNSNKPAECGERVESDAMALVDMRDMLSHAYEHGYAVAAFEVINVEVLAAVLSAAETCRAPVLLMVGNQDAGDGDLEMLMPAIEAAARRSPVPVSIQCGSVTSLEALRRAIALGCNGVAMPRKQGAFPAVVKSMREVVESARDCGVPVEGGWLSAAEGVLSGNEGPDESVWPTPAEAVALVQRTGLVVFSLDEPGSATKTRIDFPRLKILNAVLKMPLALYDASSLNEDQIRRVIFKGVAKIRVNVAINTIAKAVLTRLTANDGVSFWRAFRDEVSADAERNMRLYGSAGRAAEVLSRCKHWAVVQQVWLCTDEHLSEQAFTSLLSECRELAGNSPGVRGVFAGRTLTGQDKYRYCVVLRLSHPQVPMDAQQTQAAMAILRRSFNERCLAVGVQAFETVA